MAYVKYELKDGTIVYIESADTPRGTSGLIPAKGTEHTEPANESFDEAIDSISKMASTMMDNLRAGFTDELSELSVSFGLKASTDLGSLFVSRGGMEANYNVSMRWHKKEEKKEEANPAGEGSTAAKEDAKV